MEENWGEKQNSTYLEIWYITELVLQIEHGMEYSVNDVGIVI